MTRHFRVGPHYITCDLCGKELIRPNWEQERLWEFGVRTPYSINRLDFCSKTCHTAFEAREKNLWEEKSEQEYNTAIKPLLVEILRAFDDEDLKCYRVPDTSSRGRLIWETIARLYRELAEKQDDEW